MKAGDKDRDGEDSLVSGSEPSSPKGGFLFWRRVLRVPGCRAGSVSAADQERERLERKASMRKRVAREMGRVVMTVAAQRLELLAATTGLEQDLGTDRTCQVRRNHKL
jgi:hypothetical protein